MKYDLGPLGAAHKIRHADPHGVYVTKFKDAEHLIRLAAVVLLGFLLLLVLRSQYIPKSFGEFGFYRGAALAEISSKPINYAGHQACEVCHSEVLEIKKAGKHAGVNCEACHGPLAKHADDPSAETLKLPDTAVLCARCHEANLAKPKTFPQVVSADHSGGQVCKTCHLPHSPLLQPAPVLQSGGKK